MATLTDPYGTTGQLTLKWDPKNLEIRTMSVERTLEPLVLQVTTLVNSKDKSAKKKRPGKSKRASALVATVERATEIFIERGQTIAYENPEITQEMLAAVEEVRKAGAAMSLAAREFSEEPCASSVRSGMVRAARSLLSAVTRLLILADMVDVHLLLTNLRTVENDLDKLKSASSQSELLESARQFGRSANELAAQAARRQKELKEPRMKDELAAARAVLKKHSTMLLTASKVYVRHPELAAAKANRDFVLRAVCSAVDTIACVAQGRPLTHSGTNRVPVEGPGELAQALDDFDERMVMEPLSYSELRTRPSLEERLESIISGAALMADSSCTRDERRERIVAECNAVRQALQDLLHEYMSNAGRSDQSEGLERALGQMCRKTRDLRRQLRKAVVDHVSDSFLETNVPLLVLLEAARGGNEKEVEEYAVVFTEHANKLVEVANLVCSMSNNEDGVKMVRHAAGQIEALCPQVINAGRVLAARSRSRVAQENASAFARAWEAAVRLLTDAVDDITTIDDFLAVSENHILEDVNKCVVALQEADPDGLERTAAAIRGRATRVCSVVTQEMDNYEPCIYTKRVLEAVTVLRDQGRTITEETIFDILKHGNISEIEDLDDEDVEFDADVLFRETAGEDDQEKEKDEDIVRNESLFVAYSSDTVHPRPSPPVEPTIPPTYPQEKTTLVPRSSRRRVSYSVSRVRSRSPVDKNPETDSMRGRRTSSELRNKRKRIWKQTTFTEKAHDYPAFSVNPVRRAIDYFTDYFDTEFLEKMSHYTNLYYLRNTGSEIKSTSAEIAKVLAIHIIIGCIPYPRVPMYWRSGTKLGLICDLMARDRFLTLRNALHIVDSDSAAAEEKDNPLWKVQPMIDKVKETCNKLERVPGYYSIDEQMIPFTGRCKLRQVVKNKPRPVGLKNFVLTTTEGLMLDFEIYKGAKTNIGDSNLGLGPSVILHLVKSVPPGSCVYHDRYFTTVPLIEEMEKLGLHSTGIIMQNRIPDRATIKFKSDSQMGRGKTQQFVCQPTAIVKWKDNKSVLLASNCSAAEDHSIVKRWDKKIKAYVDVLAPKVVKNYNQHMGGVDVLDQQMEYYRAFIKTKKWTLKVLIHFLDLALVNAWRLYRNDCLANNLSRKDSMPLLDFQMNVADSLSCVPERPRREDGEYDVAPVPLRNYQIYRPAITPSEAKRYDGYEHYPISDYIKAPRTCRMEGCSSRSKIKCEKCDVYLCLSRDKNCFKSYQVLKA